MLSEVNIINVADDITLSIAKFKIIPGKKCRECERIAARELIRATLSDDGIQICHNKHGKPIIDNYNVSISHTKGYIAIILSKKHIVGIDIEYNSDRVNRITSKYLRDDEPPTSTENNLIIWCIKEATYKLFSEDMLSFSEMKVSLVDNEYALVTNLKRMSSHKAYFKITDNYTLAYIY